MLWYVFRMFMYKTKWRLIKRTCLSFDKGHKEFHRKDVKKNAWKAVAEELGFEDGKNI